jgi:hypothetical protein
MNKFTLSLVTVATLASAAVADISSKNFGGEAKLFYGTSDANDNDFFNKKGAYGDVGVRLGGAAAVGGCETCTTLNYGVTGVSTMGLESTLVSNTWAGQTAHADGINDGVWIDTLNLAFQPLSAITNTTMVLGRQALDTPMVFTEKWNIAQNTYDAAVVMNQDVEDLTLVGAWVGRTNGIDLLKGGYANTVEGQGVVRTDGISDNAFHRFLTDEGAYALGAVTKIIPMVTAQAWYYIAPSAAKTAWVQADTEYMGFGLGGQYVYNDLDGATDTGSGFGVKLGYNYEGIGLSAAYSSMDDTLTTAANLGGTQSKLYTEAWWNYGQVSQADTDAFNVSATYGLEGIADLGVYYTNADHGKDDNKDLTEIAVTAGTDLGNLNLSAAYIYGDFDGDVDAAGEDVDATSDIQVYATYKF